MTLYSLYKPQTGDQGTCFESIYTRDLLRKQDYKPKTGVDDCLKDSGNIKEITILVDCVKDLGDLKNRLSL